MTKSKWIFAASWKYRLIRHLMFWGIYSFGFFLQSLVPGSVQDFYEAGMYMIALTSTMCFLPACLFSVYTAIYLIWPKFIRTKKYGTAAAAFVLVFVADISINYFFSGLFHSSYYVRESNVGFSGQLSLAYLNAIWAITVMGLGLFIKLSKLCYLQKRENVEIARKSMRTQLDVEKSKLRPAYLYSSLNVIQEKNIEGNACSHQMILKLSDVLSYTLYESEAEFVPLNTELASLIDFIELEKLKRDGKEQILLDWDTPEDFSIPPMLILSFLQEVTAQTHETENGDWKMFIQVNAIHETLHVEIRGTFPYGAPDFSSAANKLRTRIETVYEAAAHNVQYLSRKDEFALFIELNGLYCFLDESEKVYQ